MNMKYRKDHRTAEKFADDIQKTTNREKVMIEIWTACMINSGHTVEYHSSGTDNTGKIVERATSIPDYIITLDGETALYDIKCNKYSHKNTFKVYDLKKYIEYDANILLLYGMGDDWAPNEKAKWGIITPEAMKRMLEDLKHINDFKWGNKPTVIVYDKDFDKYFESKSLI